MIGISKLYCGTIETSDVLRYGARSGELPSHLLQFSSDKRPVVVFNSTKRCNLRCVHCYSRSDCSIDTDELSTAEALSLISDLADFGSPALLFSGGEPLLRPDLFELIEEAARFKVRTVISSNGTMITPEIAKRLKGSNLSYAGISIDGLSATHNRLRGSANAFEQTMRGIRNCQDASLKVGLRFTINKYNAAEISDIFELIAAEGIPRICFYHLVSTGRASEIEDGALSHEETRRVVDLIIDETASLHAHGNKIEVLTVDNHTDGVYLYQRMLREKNPRADEVLKLLTMNGGNSTGVGMASVSWNGDVHPDQFLRDLVLGNIRERPFSEIWTDTSENDLFKKLKEKSLHVTGHCKRCKFLSICGGNFRARALAATGNLWGEDPACYLTDEEILGNI